MEPEAYAETPMNDLKLSDYKLSFAWSSQLPDIPPAGRVTPESSQNQSSKEA